MAIYDEKESYAVSRAGGIGGTDAAAILGLSPWKRPIDIYAGKVNPQAQPELNKECLYWGSALEPIVRGRYAERFGVEVIAPDAIKTFFPNSRPWRDSTLVIGREPWMLGAPDGWINSVRNGLEVKCSSRKSEEWGDEGSDEVPAHYLVQVAWYMAVMDAPAWNFAVLFSGNSLSQYRVQRDMALERDIIEAARSFWHDNVLKQVEPLIDESESYGKYLARKFSLNSGAIIKNPSPELVEWAVKMKQADDEEKDAKERKTLANNQLRALVGEAQKAITPLGTIGWIRPSARYIVDYRALAEKYKLTQPEVLKEFTFERHDEPYLRAWWEK